jgi:hypothetical protein
MWWRRRRDHLHLGCNVRTPTLLAGLALLGKGQEIEEEVT